MGARPWLAAVKQSEQFADGSGVAQLMGGAGGQRPGPAEELVADPERVRASERGTGAVACGTCRAEWHIPG
jgi:hypothetical protein